MIGYDGAPSRLLINYSGTRLDDAKEQLQLYWKEIFPDSPFICLFLGDQLVSKHKDDLQVSRIIIAFWLLSIVVSCFGLFALAQSTCRKKGSEIAIRKTLGASNQNVVYMLITDFGKWVVVSFSLGSVVGYLGIRSWMETFAYRTNIDWQVFAITFGVGMCFLLIAIGWQTFRVAKENPIRGLRYE